MPPAEEAFDPEILVLAHGAFPAAGVSFGLDEPVDDDRRRYEVAGQ
jgi:hypothetical protein